jgi:short-chain Z-isoprenyl diphosphate synthase
MSTNDESALARHEAEQTESIPVPRHVAFILDGNRRWARKEGYQNVSVGHQVGFAKIPDVLSWCEVAGIETVTLWMLSTDNIRNRAQAELDALYEIDEDIIKKLVDLRRFRLTFIGVPGDLPARLVAQLRDAEERTRDIKGLRANLAIAYGGKDDILQAVNTAVAEALKRGEDPRVTAEQVEAHLWTAGQLNPDLVIRTSGECRTSGFLMWQSAAAEYFFCDCFWPAFSEVYLREALLAYGTRERRFGR